VSSFSLPRVAIPASLRLTAGAVQDGEVYLMERVPQHLGHETPLDMLNRAEGFFPFKPKGLNGTVLLVAKARTVTLVVPRTTAPEDPARLSAARQGRLEITLADGSQLRGSVTLELPAYHSRPLDYLNASAQPFFAIQDAEQLFLINRAHVLYVRPED
jgi:hypothetical protein